MLAAVKETVDDELPLASSPTLCRFEITEEAVGKDSPFLDRHDAHD